MISKALKYLENLEESEKSTEKLDDSILVSATYNGEKKVAVLKFYNPKTNKIYLWYDNTGHKPYCLAKEDLSDEIYKKLIQRSDVIRIEKIIKKDLIKNKEINFSKIIVTDPLAIGGVSNRRSIRDSIVTWESDIKYYENYLYDLGLSPGSYYKIENSNIIKVDSELPSSVKNVLKKTISLAIEDMKKSIEDWGRLLSQPIPEFRRLALDIEVIPAEENRIPDPQEASQQVIAVGLVGSDNLRKVLILDKKRIKNHDRDNKDEFQITFFKNERDLLEEVFYYIAEYPFILTFNGDQFDLNYLFNRAQKPEIGFKKEDIPISLGNNVAYVRPGIHIDLYKTFNNRSIQIYAFNNKYNEHTLNGVAKSLLNEGKIALEVPIGELDPLELAKYCYRDSKLTYDLTNFSDSLLMKLLLVISRIAKMPIDDVARLAVSNWIRSMIYFEHRKLNAIIPIRSDLEKLEKGVISDAIIKGKKYKGGVVVEPQAGVYFNVSVLDFASLYPSIIKVYNLSYETVRCIHEKCKENKIPETNHWVCKENRGLVSRLIGSLRDVRVDYYKPLSRQTGLKNEVKELSQVVSRALKVILNASYGVMGAEIYPLYYLPAADATAAYGRYSIKKTIEKCREFGIEVVYGDTDSLFLKNPRHSQINQITRWAESELGIELDLDKVYRYAAFSQRKKNYLGVFYDGSVDVKGLTGKKSHTPEFIKKAFYDSVKILSQVQSPDEFNSAREEIKTKLREKYLALKNKEIPVNELAFNIVMSKSPKSYIKTKPQHVKAAELMILQGREVKAGDIISFIKTTNSSGVKPLSMVHINEVDTKKYEDYMRSTLDQILSPLGYEFEEIIGATKLEDFFWN